MRCVYIYIQEPPIQTWLWTKYTPTSKQHYLAVAPQQDNVPWHTTNTAQEQLEEHNKGAEVLTEPPDCPDPNLKEHLYDVLEQVWSTEAPPPSMSWQVRAVLAAQGEPSQY